MKKLLYISLAIFATLFLIIQNASAAWYNPFTWGAKPEQSVGASVLFPYQGGTGIGSVTAGDVGNCLAVADDSPFTWEVVTCGTGGGGGSGGTWSTTTSAVAGQLINYPNNNDDIVTIGSNSTTTAEFYYDPNVFNLFVKSASSTIAGPLDVVGNFRLPLLSQGFAYIGSGGKLNSLASSSILLQDLGGAVTDAQVPDSITVTLASTATALAANGANCSAGSFPLGVDASGAVETCTDAWTEAENTSAGYVAGTRALTVAGTANQITSSAGAQNLTADRTWTLSIPSQFNIQQASTTVFSALWAKIGATASTTIDTAGNVVIPSGSTLTITGTSDGCANFTSGVLGSTGVACGSGSGSSAFEIATTSDIALSQVAYINKTAGRTTLASVATSTLAVGSSLLSSGTLGYQVGGTNSSLSINTANANTWTAKQDFFGAASSTLFSSNWLKVGGTASTTLDGAGNVTYAGLLSGPYSSSTIYSSFLTASSTFANIGTLSMPSLANSFPYFNSSGTAVATTSPVFYERMFSNWASTTPNFNSTIYASGATSTLKVYLPRAVSFTAIGGSIRTGTSLLCEIGNGTASSTRILTTTAGQTSDSVTLAGEVTVACGSGSGNPDDANFTVLGEFSR